MRQRQRDRETERQTHIYKTDTYTHRAYRERERTRTLIFVFGTPLERVGGFTKDGSPHSGVNEREDAHQLGLSLTGFRPIIDQFYQSRAHLIAHIR
jgi:hypothetical protein